LNKLCQNASVANALKSFLCEKSALYAIPQKVTLPTGGYYSYTYAEVPATT
jgi:hypothetical protein